MNTVQHYPVAIIGAGFCGTMVAVNLMRQRPDMAVALIGQSPEAGPGLAYGTADADHLLNVRAGQMGAFPDDPAHFWRWLEIHKPSADVTAQSFVPRKIYGQYLKHILGECCSKHPSLAVLNHKIVNITRSARGVFELSSANGDVLTADRVVLALGNFPPDHTDAMNPYAPETWRKTADDGDILIIGTGLTSLDLVVSLAKTKPKGTIHLLSRHGLLPREHVDTAPHILKMQPPYPNTALGLLCALRAEVRNAGNTPWQSVIDAMRPLNQQLWQSLRQHEQRRFLRHLRPYWDVHRHRSPPKVMESYRALAQAGRIVLHHGSIVKQVIDNHGVSVTWRPRGKSAVENLQVRHVVSCTGPQADITKLEDVLVRNMLKNKLVTPDLLRLGILSGQDYLVCGEDGEKIEGLYVLGSLLKGKLYESVAVPELRKQAVEVAEAIVKAVN